MGWLITSVPLFLYALGIMAWNYENNPTARLIAFILGCLSVYGFLSSKGYFRRQKIDAAVATRERATAAAAKKEERQQHQLLKEWEATGYVIPEQIRSEVETYYRSRAPKLLYPIHL